MPGGGVKNLQEYLVSLGVKMDEKGMNKLDSFFKGSKVGALALGGALVTATTVAVKYFKELSEGAFTLEKEAKAQHKSVESVRASDNALKAMGKTKQEVAKDPSLKHIYNDLVKMNKAMALPDGSKGVSLLRSISGEFYALKSTLQYALQWIHYHITTKLSKPLTELRDGIEEFRKKLQADMPNWTAKIADGFAVLVRLFETAVKAGTSIIDFVRKLPKEIKTMGTAIAGVWTIIRAGPLGWLLGALTAILLLLDDYYAYSKGLPSSLPGLWEGLKDGSWVNTLGEKIQGALDTAKIKIGEFAKSLPDLIKEHQTEIDSAMALLGDIFFKGLDIASELVTVLNDPKVTAAVGGLLDILKGKVDEFAKNLPGWIEDHKSEIEEAAKNIGETLAKGLDIVGKLLGTLADTKVLAAIWNVGVELGKGILYGLTGIGEEIGYKLIGDLYGKDAEDAARKSNEGIKKGTVGVDESGNIILPSAMSVLYSENPEEAQKSIERAATDEMAQYIMSLYQGGSISMSGKGQFGAVDRGLMIPDAPDNIGTVGSKSYETWTSLVTAWQEAFKNKDLENFKVLTEAISKFQKDYNERAGGMKGWFGGIDTSDIVAVAQAAIDAYNKSKEGKPETPPPPNDEKPKVIGPQNDNEKRDMPTSSGGKTQSAPGSAGSTGTGNQPIEPHWDKAPEDLFIVIGDGSDKLQEEINTLQDQADSNPIKVPIVPISIPWGWIFKLPGNVPQTNAAGGRYDQPTETTLVEDGDPEYVIPIGKPSRAIPLIRQMLAEMGSAATDLLASLGVSPDASIDDLVASKGLGRPGGAGYTVNVVNNYYNTVTANPNITVNGNGDPSAIGQAAYNAAERNIIRTLKGVLPS